MSRDRIETKGHAALKSCLRGISWAAVVVTALAGAIPTFAAGTQPMAPTERRLLDEAIGGQCVPEAAKQVLESYRSQILNAPTLDEARSLVLEQTRLARAALSTASWLLPHSNSVRVARETIEALEARVYAANTQREVADDFAALVAPQATANASVAPGATMGAPMVLADVDLNKSAVKVHAGKGGCDYTTGEVIIIFLGFLLFIIPGIIFLILFC